ncbi:MAG: hypothetical protein ABIQ41_03175 [Gemmatimonadales bacterium]
MTGPASSHWIDLKATEFDREPGQNEAGSAFRVYVSPYDMPDAIRGRYETNPARLHIDFRYISEEPSTTQDLEPGVTVSYGKNSGRVHQIVIAIDALKRPHVAMFLHGVLEQLMKKSVEGGGPRNNFEIATRVVQAHETELLEVLP